LIAKSALQADIALNKSMANVATLIPGNITRVKELKGAVQEMAVEFALSTESMSAGLFEVISAFGDSTDTLEKMRVNSQAAVAAQTDLSTAVKLTSAVTKAWGDTSSAAQKEALNMAFITNKLGQTSFPELAASIGETTLLFKTLGASREELFAGFASLTGVLGNTSKTATGLKGAVQALLAPSDALTVIFDELELASGKALVKQEGLLEAFGLIREVSDRTGIPLNKFVGSIEGMQAVLGLTGPQAQAFVDAMGELKNSSEALDQAFLDQTEGINKLGFQLQRMQVRASVLAQNIGQGLAPSFGDLLEAVNPLLEKAAGLAKAFGDSATETQKQVVIFAGLVAALGPVILLLGTMVKTLALLSGKFLLIVGVVGAVISAFQLLRENWEKIEKAIGGTLLVRVFDRLGSAASGLVSKFSRIGQDLATSVSEGLSIMPELTKRQFLGLSEDLQLILGKLEADTQAAAAQGLPNAFAAQVAIVALEVEKEIEKMPAVVKAASANAAMASRDEWISTFFGPMKRLIKEIGDELGLSTAFEIVGSEEQIAKQVAAAERAMGIMGEGLERVNKLQQDFIDKIKSGVDRAEEAAIADEALAGIKKTLADDMALLNNRYILFGERVDIAGGRIDILRQAIEQMLQTGNAAEIGPLLALLEKLEGFERTKDEIREIGDVFQSTISTMVDSVLRNTQTMEEAFKSLGQNIILAFTSRAVQASIDQLFTSIQQQVGKANLAGAVGSSTGGAGAPGGGSIFDQIGSFFGRKTSTAPGAPGSPVLGPPPPGGLLSGFSGAGALGGLGAGFGIGTGLEGFIGGGQATQFGGAAGGALGGAFFGPAGAVGGGLLGGAIGKGLNALFDKGPGGKDKLSLRTGLDGALSVAGDTKGNALTALIEDIDAAIAGRLTAAQELILEADVAGTKLKSSSREIKDIVNEIAFKRLEQALESLGASQGIDDLAGRVLTGEKFSEEKFQNTLNAIEFINNFESSIKTLNDGLLDIDGTVEQLARESIQETQGQFRAFRDETERLGLDVSVANDAIKNAVEVMVGLREAKEPLSETEVALKQVRAEFDALAPLLDEVGISAEAAGQGLIKALGDIRQGFESEIQRQINAFRSPITNTLEDLFATQARRLSDAQAVNADLGPVVELIGEEFKSVVSSLDATQLQTAIRLITANVKDLGDTLGGDVIAGLSSVFQPSAGVNQANQRIVDATEELTRLQNQVVGTSNALGRVQATANDVANIFESLGQFRNRLLQSQFSTLSPGARFAQAQGQFERTAAGALGGDVAALAELENVSEAFLQANQDYFASSNPKAFTRVLEVLGQAQSISELEFITAQRQADTLNNQLAQLEQQVIIQEEELQAEIDALAELEALSLGQTEQTEKLEAAILSIAAEIKANGRASAEALAAVQQAAADSAAATDVQTQAVTDLLSSINENVNEGNRGSQQLLGVS
jgi:TP901 family phage tail tape measure protein